MWPFKRKLSIREKQIQALPELFGAVRQIGNALLNDPSSFEIRSIGKSDETRKKQWCIGTNYIAISYSSHSCPWDVQYRDENSTSWALMHLDRSTREDLHKHVEFWKHNNTHLLEVGVSGLDRDAILVAAEEYIEKSPEIALTSSNQQIRDFAEKLINEKKAEQKEE